MTYWVQMGKDTLFLVFLLLALGSAGGLETAVLSFAAWMLYTIGFLFLAVWCLHPWKRQVWKKASPCGRMEPVSTRRTAA